MALISTMKTKLQFRREHLNYLDEFENKIMMTTILEDVDVIISEYCYSYNETQENRNNLRFIY